MSKVGIIANPAADLFAGNPCRIADGTMPNGAVLELQGRKSGVLGAVAEKRGLRPTFPPTLLISPELLYGFRKLDPFSMASRIAKSLEFM